MLSVVAGLSSAAAVPPPPPPPGAIPRAQAIIQMPRTGDLTPYVEQFADDVVLFDKQGQSARGKVELLRYFQAHQWLRINVHDVSYGNPIIATESVTSIPDQTRPDVVYDCCFWARIATYHLNSANKVDRIEFIENGSYWGPPEDPR